MKRVLLPLTETPVSEELLGAMHARLSGQAHYRQRKKSLKQAVRSGGVSVFPGWEFYAPVAGADRTVFDLLPNCGGADRRTGKCSGAEFDRVWTRIERGP